MSYSHRFDYAITSGIKVSAEFELARVSNGKSARTGLSPSFRLDWRGSSGTALTIDLKLSPRRIGEDFNGSFFQNGIFRR